MGQNESNQVSSSGQKYSREPTHSTTKSLVKGITVVNKPDTSGDSSNTKPNEIEKLEKLHKFWPILRSTLDYEYPLESFEDGISHKHVLNMCNLYKDYLSTAAQATANEQRLLVSRMKDLEMFSAGIVQQLSRRQDRIEKMLPHLHKVKEVSTNLQETSSLLNSCVPLMNRINNLLPEQERLEQLTIHISPVHEHLVSPQTSSDNRSNMEDRIILESETVRNLTEQEHDDDDDIDNESS